MRKIREIDGLDARILKLLAEDGRLSWRELSERIGLSLTPTLRRTQALERKGYIQGYRARLSERRLAGSMIAIVNVTVDPRTCRDPGLFEGSLSQIPGIMSAFLMSNGSEYLLRVVAGDLVQLRKLLLKIAGIDGVSHLRSGIAVKSVIDDRLSPSSRVACLDNPFPADQEPSPKWRGASPAISLRLPYEGAP